MKMVLIGGGSYVFAPTVLADAILKHRLSGLELSLVDLNLDAAEAMAGVGRRMAADAGVDIHFNVTDDYTAALAGADFVIVSAAVQGFKRWMMDYEILKELHIPDQARENGGVGGLMYSFRSITLLMDIAKKMEKLCPNALLLIVTNPLPRVVTAVNKYSSIRAIGFCNIAWRGVNGYEWFANLVGKSPHDINVVTAGLNHFAWLLEIQDKKTGEDLFPLVRSKVLMGTDREMRIMKRWFYEYGGIIAGHVDHHGEYLPLDPDIHYAQAPPFHGDIKERENRINELREIARGRATWEGLLEHGSWEHPVDVAAALYYKKEQAFDAVNIPNDGYIKELPNGRIVEVPACAHQGILKGQEVPALPQKVAKLCRQISDVHELAADAAVTGDRRIAERAIELDPAVVDKKAALLALDRMLKAHADILPQFH